MKTHRFPYFAGRVAAVACAALTLAACSILPKHAPVQVWQPPSHATVQPGGATSSLRVATPRATGLLDATGIVVMPEPGRVSTYAGARWSKAPALIVRARLVDAFMAAGLPTVTTDDDRFTSDYVLSGNLRAFQAEYRGGAPVVVVRFDAQVRKGGSLHLLATHSFVITRQPAGTDIAQVVAAFGAADDALAAQVVHWLTHAAQ